MRRIHWNNVSISNTKRVADLSGLEVSPLEDLCLADIQAIGAKTGIHCENAKGVRFENLDVQAASGPTIEVQNVSRVEVLRLTAPQPNEDAPVISFKDVSGALAHDCTVSAGSGVFLRLADTGSTGVTCEGNRLAAGIKERVP